MHLEPDELIQIAKGLALGCAAFYGVGALRDLLIYLIKKFCKC